jgi:hypothetical protein
LATVLFEVNTLCAQNADTVVVYEYVYVTDTVWKEAPARDTIIISQLNPIENATLVIDTTSKKADLVIFSSTGSATIPINCIILSDQQQNFKSMKRIAFLGLTLLALNTASYAQNEFKENLSIFIKGDISNQRLNSLLGNDFYWYIGNEYLLTPGLGIASQIPIDKFISFKPSLSYIQRGCSKSVQDGIYFIYSPDVNSHIAVYTNDRHIQDRFHYMSIDLTLKIGNTLYRKVQPSFYAGLRGDLLLWKNLEYDADEHAMYENTNYKNFNRFNFGWVSGFGLEMKHKWYVEAEMNSDLGYLVKDESLKVKNIMLSVNLGIYLNKIPHYKIVKAEK